MVGSPDLTFVVAEIGGSADVAVGDDKSLADVEEGGKGGEGEHDGLHFKRLVG